MLFRTEMLAFATSLVYIKVYFSLCVGGFKKLIDAPREIVDLVRNDGTIDGLYLCCGMSTERRSKVGSDN